MKCLSGQFKTANEKLTAVLERVRQCCLFEEDLGSTGVTTEPHIDEQLFDDICAALNQEPTS